MIAQLPAHHEPLEREALRRALDAILARPVNELPTPDETLTAEIRQAAGRASAQKVVAKFQQRRPGGRPPFDRLAVGDDLAAGMSILDVTAKHGISDTTAKVIRQERGIVHHKVPVQRYDRAHALRDLAGGMLAPEVAAKHQVHVQTIRALRRRQREGRE